MDNGGKGLSKRLSIKGEEGVELVKYRFDVCTDCYLVVTMGSVIGDMPRSINIGVEDLRLEAFYLLEDR